MLRVIVAQNPQFEGTLSSVYEVIYTQRFCALRSNHRKKGLVRAQCFLNHLYSPHCCVCRKCAVFGDDTDRLAGYAAGCVDRQWV